MEYWLNKLRFLFTGKLRIWTLQENCARDFSDCNECGAGLYHWSSDHLTYDEAMVDALDMVKQQLEYGPEEPKPEIVINKDDPKHVTVVVKVGDVEQSLWYEIIQCEIERSKK